MLTTSNMQASRRNLSDEHGRKSNITSRSRLLQLTNYTNVSQCSNSAKLNALKDNLLQSKNLCKSNQEEKMQKAETMSLLTAVWCQFNGISHLRKNYVQLNALSTMDMEVVGIVLLRKKNDKVNKFAFNDLIINK